MAQRSGRLILLVLAACLLFSLMGVSASAEDTVIEKVYATSDKEAIVMRTAGEIVFTTSTEGAVVSAVSWTDASGKILGASDAFGQGTYTLVVKLTAKDGYTFGAAAGGYLYGKSCDIAVSADGKTVSLRRNIAPPVWSPTVIKQPAADPPVEPGGRVSYAASASFAASHVWYFVSPDGQELLDADAAQSRFAPASITDTGASLIIDNVQAEMNGWKVKCRFYESTKTYSTDTQTAEILVKQPAPTPTPPPTPAPSAEAAPEATEEPAPTASPGSAPETPPLLPPRAWQYNEGGHWHENAAGETSDLGEHSFVWSAPDENGMETGVCSICGYTAERESPEAARHAFMGRLLIGLGVTVAVLMMLTLAAPRRKKRSRR